MQRKYRPKEVFLSSSSTNQGGGNWLLQFGLNVANALFHSAQGVGSGTSAVVLNQEVLGAGFLHLGNDGLEVHIAVAHALVSGASIEVVQLGVHNDLIVLQVDAADTTFQLLDGSPYINTGVLQPIGLRHLRRNGWEARGRSSSRSTNG